MDNSILFGAAYYPEAWPESERPYDIKMMKEAGMNVMRVGEFAWHKMEPKQGCYDFKWLHDVIDDLANNGIKTILGTPTATPPRWFLQNYPMAAKLWKDGLRATHGDRRHLCSNNPDYIRESLKIVEEMGKEFGSDPNVIAWQLDNEIYSTTGCVCEYCVNNYHRFLKKRYDSIEALNDAWVLDLFSQAYDDFSQIHAPATGWQSPHMKMTWDQAHHESDIAFIHAQATVLKKYTNAPIGTDMMPVLGMSYKTMCDPLDMVQFNHYNTEEDLMELPLWYDHFRTLGKPFINTETATGWNGSNKITQVMKPEGFCRANSWLPIALGGEGNLYWLWRQHRAGHELTHGSVIYANGRPLPMFSEVQQLSREYKTAESFLNATKVKTCIAMHYCSLSWQMLKAQPTVDGIEYLPRLTKHFYLPLTESGIRPDLIDQSHSLDDYKVLFSPLVMSLTEADKIENWVRNGGIWVAGPMTDIRTPDGTHFTKSATGLVERLTGATLTASVPDSGKYVKSEWADGGEFKASKWQELYTPTGDVYASVTEGYGSLIGSAIVQCIKVGKGQVWLLGTLPTTEDMKKLITLVCENAGMSLPEVSGSVTVIPREGGGRKGVILIETANAEAQYTLNEPMTDILSGKQYNGKINLAPYDILMLEK